MHTIDESNLPVEVQRPGSSLSDGAAFFLLISIPFLTALLFGGVDPITWTLVTGISAAFVLLWLYKGWRYGLFMSSSRLPLPLVSLLLIGIVQLLPLGGSDASGDLSLAASKSISLNPYATRIFVTELAVYIAFLAGCLTFINSESRLRRVVNVTIIFGAGMAFFGILQRLANPDGIYGLRETPQAVPFGPFVNQHHFAAFMEMTGGLALGLMFDPSYGRERKMLLAIAAGIMAIAVLWTGSRGGLIAFLSVIVFIALVHRLTRRQRSASSARRKLVLATLTAAFVFITAGTLLFLGGADQLMRGTGISGPASDISTGRSHFWPIAVRIWLAHPLIGAGLDTFGTAYPQLDTWNGNQIVERAHNDYLQTLADAGLAGLLCVAAFIYLLFKGALKTISEIEELRRGAAIGALGGCFGVLIHSFFDFPLRTPSNAFFFLLLAAIATVPIAAELQAAHRRRKHRRA